MPRLNMQLIPEPRPGATTSPKASPTTLSVSAAVRRTASETRPAEVEAARAEAERRANSELDSDAWVSLGDAVNRDVDRVVPREDGAA